MTSPTARPHSSDQLREVVGLVDRLPFGSGDLTFDEPWQLRAFALVVAAHEAGQYAWSDFQSALIASIKDWEAANGAAGTTGDRTWSYFEHWVDAVESVLAKGDLVDAEILETRVRDVLDAPANRNHHEPHYEPVSVAPAVG